MFDGSDGLIEMIPFGPKLSEYSINVQSGAPLFVVKFGQGSVPDESQPAEAHGGWARTMFTACGCGFDKASNQLPWGILLRQQTAAGKGIDWEL